MKSIFYYCKNSNSKSNNNANVLLNSPRSCAALVVVVSVWMVITLTLNLLFAVKYCKAKQYYLSCSQNRTYTLGIIPCSQIGRSHTFDIPHYGTDNTAREISDSARGSIGTVSYTDKMLIKRNYPTGFNTTAASAVVIEATSGQVLFEKNSKQTMPLASTTKILTALVVLNECELSEVVKITRESVGIEGSSVYLKEGECLTVEDLLYGLMLRSGNDCAVALAIHVSGSIEKFANLMNQYARTCGATASNFTNPHGLHCEEHYTTALDLAKISSAAMNDEQFRSIVSSKKYTTKGDAPTRVFINKNKLLSNMTGANGVKTGYTKKAGRCFVGSANIEGMQMIVVLLNCAPMFEDARRMLEYACSSYTMTAIVYPNQVLNIVQKHNKRVISLAKYGYSIPITKSHADKTHFRYQYDKVGKCAIVYVNDVEVVSLPTIQIEIRQ